MTALELMKEYLDREQNNVFCYSANYLMNSPKKGYEKEWQRAEERCRLLRELIDRISGE